MKGGAPERICRGRLGCGSGLPWGPTPAFPKEEELMHGHQGVGVG